MGKTVFFPESFEEQNILVDALIEFKFSKEEVFHTKPTLEESRLVSKAEIRIMVRYLYHENKIHSVEVLELAGYAFTQDGGRHYIDLENTQAEMQSFRPEYALIELPEKEKKGTIIFIEKEE